MIDGGALTITLTRRGALIDAPPPLSWSRMAVGKPAAEAARLAGVVADCCPTAHEAAARAALGLAPLPGADRRMAQEALREHVFKGCVAWPAALGWAPEPLPAGAEDADSASAALFGPDGMPEHIDAFEIWMAREATPAARTLHHVWRRWDCRWGRADLPLWRPGERIGGVDWREAELDGAPFDASVAARMADAHLMREVEARRGRGLTWRLLARLADAARLIAALRGEGPAPEARTLAPGIGAAEASTGCILAFGALEAGRVSRFEQLSPTDIALHPEGLLRRMLDAGPQRRDAPRLTVAALTLEAVDPRLPVRLTVSQTPTRAPAAQGRVSA